MSRKLNVASALLLINGLWGVVDGLMALFSPEWYLDVWITMLNEGLRPPTVSVISDLGQNLLEFMTWTTGALGWYMLFGALLFCVISLIPYRKGEKWAWYTMLVIGGFHTLGGLIITYIDMTSHLLVPVIMTILWIVGIALPAKEILGKAS